MSKEMLPMHKIQAVLELHHERQLSIRKIAGMLALKRSTVNDYVSRANRANVPWPLPDEWDENDLTQALFGAAKQQARKKLPDWGYIHTEMRRKGVTLQLLHEEYLQKNPEGYRYSQFCEHYRRFNKSLNLCMRQSHLAGDKMFVDFAGQTVTIVDLVGTTREAQLFVAVLGASNYTYAEAVASQSVPDWIDLHCNALEYFGGVPAFTICDNLKSAVTTPCRYEPTLNDTYEDWARHYGTCIIPARIKHPQDKAKVEAGVLVAERWILAALRNRTFFSLAELNTAIRDLLEQLNSRAFKKLPGNRGSLFRELEKPALSPLRSRRYEFAEWREAKVNIDYHVSVHLGERQYHYYSVPYTLVGQQLRIRLSLKTLEAYRNGKRVSAHLRDDSPGKSSTLIDHMPKAHKRHAEWTPGRILNWAEETGDACRRVADLIMAARPHPEQGFRSCLGLISLAKNYGRQRLETACHRALVLGIELTTYKSIKNMLANNQDKLPLPDDEQLLLPLDNSPNVRGSVYYH